MYLLAVLIRLTKTVYTISPIKYRVEQYCTFSQISMVKDRLIHLNGRFILWLRRPLRRHCKLTYCGSVLPRIDLDDDVLHGWGRSLARHTASSIRNLETTSVSLPACSVVLAVSNGQ